MYAQQQGPSYTVIHAAPIIVPPRGAVAFLYTSGCSVCLLLFGIFLTFAGSVMTGISYKKPSPPFDKPFFTKHDEDNPLRIVGPVLLSVGLFLLVTSVILCCVMAAKHQKRRGQVLQDNNQQPIQTSPQASSLYPQQLHAPYSSPPNIYQEDVPTSSYPSQQYILTNPYISQPNVPTSSYPSQQIVTTSPYPPQPNVPTTSYPSQQDDIPPPSYYDSTRDDQSNIPSKTTFNNPGGDNTLTCEIPSASRFDIPVTHSYQPPQWK